MGRRRQPVLREFSPGGLGREKMDTPLQRQKEFNGRENSSWGHFHPQRCLPLWQMGEERWREDLWGPGVREVLDGLRKAGDQKETSSNKGRGRDPGDLQTCSVSNS